MRIMVMFDLPVVTKTDRRAYTLFRRFLLNDGYDMIQFSVYGRILNGADAEEKHMKRLVTNLPPEGSVRVLTVTEKQYASMKLLVGRHLGPPITIRMPNQHRWYESALRLMEHAANRERY